MKKTFTLVVITILSATLIYGQIQKIPSPIMKKKEINSFDVKKNIVKSKEFSFFKPERDFTKKDNNVKVLKTRSDNEYLVKMDSICAYNNENLDTATLKYAMSYYANGDIEQLIIAFWDQDSNCLINNRRFDYTYPSEGEKQFILKLWDTESQDWEKEEKQINKYDSNNNEILDASYDWDSDINDWIGDDKLESVYDANGNQTSHIRFDWDSNTSDWIKSDKVEYAYDANNNRTKKISYYWDSNASDWIKSDKVEYTYDANNKIEKMSYYWDSNADDWMKSGKSEFTYDANNNKTKEMNYYWDSNADDWMKSRKTEFTYDANNNKTEEKEYNWDDNINDWVKRYKYTYTFNDNNDRTSEADYEWNSNTNTWNKDSKYEYSFLETAFIDVMMPWNFDLDYHEHALAQQTGYDADNDSWVFDRSFVFYYSDLSSSVQNIASDSKLVYPNPADNYLIFNIDNQESANVKIYSLTGELVLQQEIRQNESVDVSFINEGVYVYKINTGNTVKTGKVVIK